MGVKERRERERLELRQSILSAARRIAAEEGWQSLTMRKVADLIEYSAPTIYEYFESKEAILYDLMREGFRTLAQRLRAAYNSASEPRERLLRVSVAYCRFAWDDTELYHVMHGTSGAHCTREDAPPPELAELAGVMMDTVRSALDLDETLHDRIMDALDVYRGLLHGMVSLTLEGILHGGQARAQALVERAVLHWRDGWRSDE
jgi:AcrR family transcriptional regulator